MSIIPSFAPSSFALFVLRQAAQEEYGSLLPQPSGVLGLPAWDMLPHCVALFTRPGPAFVLPLESGGSLWFCSGPSVPARLGCSCPALPQPPIPPLHLAGWDSFANMISPGRERLPEEPLALPCPPQSLHCSSVLSPVMESHCVVDAQ